MYRTFLYLVSNSPLLQMQCNLLSNAKAFTIFIAITNETSAILVRHCLRYVLKSEDICFYVFNTVSETRVCPLSHQSHQAGDQLV